MSAPFSSADVADVARSAWVRLVTLPFKIYVLSAYLTFYLALIPRDYLLGDWVHLCFLGYVVSFSILVVAGLIRFSA